MRVGQHDLLDHCYRPVRLLLCHPCTREPTVIRIQWIFFDLGNDGTHRVDIEIQGPAQAQSFLVCHIRDLVSAIKGVVDQTRSQILEAGLKLLPEGPLIEFLSGAS